MIGFYAVGTVILGNNICQYTGLKGLEDAYNLRAGSNEMQKVSV